MRCPADHLPRIAEIRYVAAPSLRLIADPEAVLRCKLTQFREVRRHPVHPAQSRRVLSGRDQHQIGTEFIHLLETALNTLEDLATQRLRQALEIHDRIEEDNIESVVPHDATN